MASPIRVPGFRGVWAPLVALALLTSCQAAPPRFAAPSVTVTASPVDSIAVDPISTDPGVMAQRREAGLPLFDYDASAELDLALGEPMGFTGDLALLEISYDSPGGGRASGLLMVPPDTAEAEPAPVVILQHGLPGRAREMLDLAVDLGLAGVASLMIDAPFARQGRTGASGADVLTFTQQDRDEQIQLIVDLRRAVDVLDALPETDGDRVGFLGYSYGAAVGALLAGVEPRIGAFVLMVGDAGLVQHFVGPPADPAFEALDPARRESWIDVMEPIESIYYLPGAEARLLIMNARADALVDRADAERLHAAAPAHAELVWYDSGHQLPAEAYCEAATWLGGHLDFAGEGTRMCAAR